MNTLRKRDLVTVSGSYVFLFGLGRTPEFVMAHVVMCDKTIFSVRLQRRYQNNREYWFAYADEMIAWCRGHTGADVDAFHVARALAQHP